MPYTWWCVWWRKWLFTAGVPACAAKANGWSLISMPFHPCVHVCLFMCVGEPTSQFLPVERLCAEAHLRGAVGSGQYEVGGARCSVELSHPHILIHCYFIVYATRPCVYLVKNNSPSSPPVCRRYCLEAMDCACCGVENCLKCLLCAMVSLSIINSLQSPYHYTFPFHFG